MHLKRPGLNVIRTASGALQIGAPGSRVSNHPTNRPLIALEHLSLYILKNLGQSVALCGILWKDRSCQTKVRPDTVGHSQVKPGTARYSAEKTHHVQYF